ncbi:MAG: hypothetical protein ICV34_05220, partial [Rubrobacter sp.]|nr:hypothetical protein [Rubrobacter sp.]
MRERGEESVLVELGSEFERHDLKYLMKTVDKEDRRRRAHAPAEGGLDLFGNLFGVAFLEVEITREPTIFSYLCAHYLVLR